MRGEARLTRGELARATRVSADMLARLVQLGVLEPAQGTRSFSVTTVARVRRVVRLHEDLEVDLLGAAIIADLVERLDGVEAELGRLRARRRR